MKNKYLCIKQKAHKSLTYQQRNNIFMYQMQNNPKAEQKLQFKEKTIKYEATRRKTRQ